MRVLLSVILLVIVALAWPVAQTSDLDQLMERVLARRDENWKKLQQYVLDETETLDITGPGGVRLFGFRNDHTWFLRDGMFVRSPLRANGVTISESKRRDEEQRWIRRERRREQRRAERAAASSAAGPSAPSAANPSVPSAPSAADASAPSAGNASAPSAPSAPSAANASAPSAADPSAAQPASTLVSADITGLEPAFVSHAYFLRFRFEPNHYGLVGRETLDGRTVLRIEYYPTELFREGRTRPNRKVRDREEDIEDKMNKVSLVTLWVDPDALQIVQYTFDDIDMDFLPGRAFARVDDMKATMRMGQPFPGVWLPRDIEMRFRASLAAGAFDARYRVEYHDYRQADVTYKVR